jgi:hypothetical protein
VENTFAQGFRTNEAESLAITATAGLVGSLATGAISNGRIAAELDTAVALTFTASKDNCVAMDLVNGGISVYVVAVGAAAPEKGSTEVWLGRVTTNATDITAIDLVTDVPTQPLQGAKIVDLTVTSGKVGPAAIVAGKIADGGVSAATQFASSVVSVQSVAPYSLPRSAPSWKQISRG